MGSSIEIPKNLQMHPELVEKVQEIVERKRSRRRKGLMNAAEQAMVLGFAVLHASWWRMHWRGKLPLESRYPHWKILHTDNFGGDYPAEQWVEGLPFLTEQAAHAIAKAINDTQPEDARRFYRAELSNYALKPGFEP